MGYRIAAIALGLVAARAEASDDVSIETFDARALGAQNFSVHNAAFMFDTKLGGGMVIAGTAANWAHSGTQVYQGTKITLVTENENDFTWPGIGAWVSGTDTIWLEAFEYDAALGTDVALTPKPFAPAGTDICLSIGLSDPVHHIAKAVFSSDSSFTLDDLTLGIEGIGPGMPEPASWATMMAGLGMVGGAMRARRRGTAAHAP